MLELNPDVVRRIRGKESQAAFCRRISCAGSTLSCWESGKHSVSRAYTTKLRALAGRRGIK